MYRRELLDRSLEKEKAFMEKKLILERLGIKFSISQTFPLQKITCPFLFYLSLEGGC